MAGIRALQRRVKRMEDGRKPRPSPIIIFYGIMGCLCWRGIRSSECGRAGPGSKSLYSRTCKPDEDVGEAFKAYWDEEKETTLSAICAEEGLDRARFDKLVAGERS